MGTNRPSAHDGKIRGIARSKAKSQGKSMMRLSLPQELAATFCDASNADVIGVRAKNLGPGNVQPTYRLAIGPWSFLDVQPRSARPVISFPHQKPSGRALSLRPSHAKTPRSSGGFS